MAVRNGPQCIQRPKSTGQSQTVAIHQESLRNTALWSATATLEYGGKRLGQSQTARIRRVTRSAGLTRNTIESVEVGPVVLPTWLITS